MRKIYIYILGVVLLGLLQYLLKIAVPNGAALFLIVIAYLVIVRLIAEKFGTP